MKKVLTIVMLAMLCIKGTAQLIKVGPAIGANLVKIDGQTFDQGYQLGYFAGAFVEVNMGKHWQIQPELLFGETSFDQASKFRDVYKNLLSADSLSKIKLQQLTIPVLLNYKLANVLALQLGPQFSLRMNKNETLLKNAGNTFADGDFAMVAGAKIMVGKLRFTGRYAVGLSNMNEIDRQDTWKSQTAQLGIGFVF